MIKPSFILSVFNCCFLFCIGSTIFQPLRVAAQGASSNCPVPGNNCIPGFKQMSQLQDTAYINCDLSKILDPGLDKSGTILYKWTAPDGTTFNSAYIIASQEGLYTLCYDTAAENSLCPKSDTVRVLTFKKKIAFAGPDVVGCSKQLITAGLGKDNPAYIYNWQPQQILVGGNLNKSIQQIYFENTSTVQFVTRVIMQVTEKTTGCKDSDTIRVQIYPLPVLSIPSIQPFYCAEQNIQLDLLSYFPSAKPFYSRFKIDGNILTLPKAKDTTIIIANSPYAALKYSVTLPGMSAGDVVVNFYDSTATGCKATIDSVLHIKASGSDPSGPCYGVTATVHEESASMMHIFPNPFNEALMVEPTKANSAQTYNVKFTDSKGVVHLNQNISSTEYRITTDALPAGLYTIEILSGGELSYHKVVKIP